MLAYYVKEPSGIKQERFPNLLYQIDEKYLRTGAYCPYVIKEDPVIPF